MFNYIDYRLFVFGRPPPGSSLIAPQKFSFCSENFPPPFRGKTSLLSLDFTRLLIATMPLDWQVAVFNFKPIKYFVIKNAKFSSSRTRNFSYHHGRTDAGSNGLTSKYLAECTAAAVVPPPTDGYIPLLDRFECNYLKSFCKSFRNQIKTDRPEKSTRARCGGAKTRSSGVQDSMR